MEQYKHDSDKLSDAIGIKFEELVAFANRVSNTMSEQNKWSKAIEVLETECKTSEVSLRSLCFLFVQVVMDGASVQIINKEDVTIQ